MENNEHLFNSFKELFDDFNMILSDHSYPSLEEYIESDNGNNDDLDTIYRCMHEMHVIINQA